MAKTPNLSASETFRLTVSAQSYELLEELARRGIYGRNAAEVAARFVDDALARFVDAPKLKVKLAPRGTGEEGG